MNSDFEIKQLSENLYFIRENYAYSANILVIKGQESLLVVDGGFFRAAQDLQGFISDFFKLPVEIMIASHDHADHIGLNKFVDKQSILYIHQNGKVKLDHKKVIQVDKPKTISFNEIIKLYPMDGGHSSSDMIVYFPDSKAAYLGDIYLSESFPLIGVSTGNKASLLAAILKDIYKLLPEETKLIPGHGKITNMQYLKNYISMLEATISLVISEKRKLKSILKIQQMDILKDFNEWGKYFEFVTKNSWIEDIYLTCR